MTGGLLSKLAPHLLVGLSGTSLSARERALLSRYPFAGVVLFERNVADRDQLRAMTADINALLGGPRGRSPIVAADHEGGRISVLSVAIGTPPSQMAIGRAGDLSLCGRVYRETARRAARCGVTMLLGPVADVNSQPLNPVIGTRSFGEDPGAVSRYIGETVATLRAAGILTCLKHFPGHGSSADDSHMTLPILGRDIDELRRYDLAPFRRGIAEGADAVMVGHIAPRGSELAASLDRGIIDGLLRSECGFGGVVVTDALEMAGVWMTGWHDEDADAIKRGSAGRGRDFSEVLRLALEAGNDLLLFSRTVGRVVDELEPRLSGIDGNDSFWHGRFGELSAASRRRIEKLRLGAESKGDGEPANEDEDIGHPYREVARRATAVIRDPHSLLPLSSIEDERIAFLGRESDREGDVVKRFCAAVTESLKGSVGKRSAPASGEILFLLHRRPMGKEELETVTGDAAVVVVCDWPYAAQLVAPAKTVLVTYGIYDGAADEIARRLAAPKTD